MNRLPKRIVIGIILFTFISIFLSAAISYYINREIIDSSNPWIINDIKKLPETSVALVLGAMVWEDGELSHILLDRVNTGIELYKQKKVNKLLFSGDHGRKKYDEVNAMKKYAISKGVSVEDIFLDHAGFRTYDSIYRAKNIFNIKSMIIVTQSFHLNRAVYTAREVGVSAIGFPSDKRIYIHHYVNHIREFLARVNAYLDLHLLTKKPKILGPKIDITGSGVITHD